MPLKLPTLLIAVFSCLMVSAQQSIELEPVKDNTLFERTDGSLSNGQGEFLFFGNINSAKDPQNRRRMVMQFDIAGNVPSNATITSAILSLNVNRTRGGALDVALHRLLVDWGEGPSNAGGVEGKGVQSEIGDATWIHTFYNTQFWSTAGGDFNPIASASTSVAGVSIYTWSSSQMVQDVQNWLADPNQNFGYLFLADETKNTHGKRSNSRESATASLRPKLTLTYTVPCIDPDIPTFTIAPNPVCPDSTVRITTNGNLNDAQFWALYSAGCGTNLVATDPNGVFDITATTTQTYFVRGEGGCITPSVCGQAQVQVAPTDDPSFSYATSVICDNAQPVAPEVTGEPNASYSTSNPGLILDENTGVITPIGSDLGRYTITRTTNGANCPAQAQFTIDIVQGITTLLEESICEGSEFIFDGQALATEGTYVASYPGSNGCDSIVTLELAVLDTVINPNNQVVICRGEVYSNGGQDFTTAGFYEVALPRVNGCDSLFQFELVVNDPIQVNQSEQICAGDSFLFFTDYLKEPGVYEEILVRENGCDSTIRLSLQVNPSEAFFDTLFVCTGDSVLYQGNYLKNTGIYAYPYVNQFGCDSVYNLRIYRSTPKNSNQVVQICKGDIFQFGTQQISEAGVYFETFEAANTCDSTVRLEVLVFAVDTSVTIGTGVLSANEVDASYQWLNCNAALQEVPFATNKNFASADPGNFAVEVTKLGCVDTSRCFQLTPTGISENENKTWTFTNPVTDVISLRFQNYQPRLKYQIIQSNGVVVQTGEISAGLKQVDIDVNQLAAGNYIFQLHDYAKQTGFSTFVKR